MAEKRGGAIYSRVSTDKQGQQGESLEEQEAMCRKFCKENNIEVVKVFSDQYTGTSLDRPAMQEMFEYIAEHKGKIDVCVIHKLDRSTRSGIGAYETIRQTLENLGVKLQDAYGVIQNDINVLNFHDIDTNKYDWARFRPSAMGESMMILAAEQERRSILQRTLTQEIKNIREGYVGRQSNFGFENKKISDSNGKRKTIQVEHPMEGPWIREMFKLAANGVSDPEIVEVVNAMGFKSRISSKWSKDRKLLIGEKGGHPLTVKQLQQFLVKPIYAGIIKEKWTGDKAIRAKYPGLVSIETFNRANRGKVEIEEKPDGSVDIYYGKKRAPEKPVYERLRFIPDYPFSRVLRCPRCNGHLTPNKSKSRNGDHYYYYQCKGKFNTKHPNYSFQREVVNTEVLRFMDELCFNKDGFELFLSVVDKVWKEREVELFKENDISKKIEVLESRKQELLGKIESFAGFPEILVEKNEELRRIKENIASLKAWTIRVSDPKEGISAENFKEFSKNILTHLRNMLDDEKNERLVGTIFDIIFEEKPTFEEIRSNTAKIYPVFALVSNGSNEDNNKHTPQNEECVVFLGWQPQLESNRPRRIWSPEF